jgi:hypothetical protein
VSNNADIERLIYSLGKAQSTGLIFLPDAASHREELVVLVARPPCARSPSIACFLHRRRV